MKASDISVLDLPLSKLLKLEKSDLEGYLFKIKSHPDILNHVSTMHAGVLFSLAESTSGQFLLDAYNKPGSELIPVLRNAEIKYRKPGTGPVYSRAELISPQMPEIEKDLKLRKRTLIKVKSEVLNEKGELLLTAYFNWFVTAK